MEILSSVIILLGIIVVFTNEYFQHKLGVPMIPTMPKVRKKMIEQIPTDNTGDIVDFGSGWGGLAFLAAKEFPNCKVVGVEVSLFPLLFARIRKLFSPKLKNLSFVREDFFEMPLDNVSVALCYLNNILMARLKDKFVKELHDKAHIISCNFFIPDWDAKEEIDIKGLWSSKVFVYKKEGLVNE